MDKPKQPESPKPEGKTDDHGRKKIFDPREQAIKYKAYRHIFSDKDVKKGLDEKSIIRKIKKSKSLSGRYRQYLEMRDDDNRGSQVYPWQNPFNRFLFWSAYWIPRFLKWGTLLALALFILNYLPGPTQHIVEILIARSIYDTAPIERLPDDLETYAHSCDIKDSRGAIIKSYGKRKVTQQIPVAAQRALLACEDHYFLPDPGNAWYENLFLIHPGVSWLNLIGAVKDTLQGDKRGASTLVMQNAKKILGNDKRTIANKLEEIIIAYMMVAKFGKEKNLNFYINTVPVGANIYGFPAAATNYFKKDLSALNMQQLVTIGSFIPNHNRQVAFYEIVNGKNFKDLSPSLQGHAKSAISKINLALTYLHNHHEIPDDQYRSWLLSDEASIRRIGFRDFRSPLYGEEEWTSWNVIKEVSSRTYTINGREVSGSQLLLDEKGAVSIETGTDLSLIEKMKEIINEFLKSSYFKDILSASNQATWQRDKERYTSRGLTPPYTDFDSFLAYLQRNINVGLIAVDQKGEIVAYVGGKEFLQTKNNETDEDEDEAPDPSETAPADSGGKSDSRKAVIIDIMNTKAKITPSSTMKPIIAYYAMVANNVKMSDRFADKPIEYRYVASAGKQIWMPRNWYHYDANRPMGREYSLLEAQVISINTIFARLYTNPLLRNAMLLGFDQVGLDYSKEDARYWPFGIGASAVSLQQWLGIYNAFLDGQYRDPSFVRRIQINGKTVYDRDQDPKYAKIPLFDSKKEREAEMNALYEVCNRGTAAAMGTEFKFHKNLVSGKTGTAPMNKSALFISHFNPYRDRQAHKDRTITMLISVTTNTGGFKSVGTSGNAPVKIAGRIYNYLFQQEMQEMMDKNIDKAKREDTHFRNNQVYWANVNRYMDTLMTGKCGNSLISDNIIGVDEYGEALRQILNSNTQIYTGRDDVFSQLVQYYCDQEKMVRMDSAPKN
ncbi:MAG: transglycosylase domain-containing protein [Desulfurivibrionaceae bacterium]